MLVLFNYRSIGGNEFCLMHIWTRVLQSLYIRLQCKNNSFCVFFTVVCHIYAYRKLPSVSLIRRSNSCWMTDTLVPNLTSSCFTCCSFSLIFLSWPDVFYYCAACPHIGRIARLVRPPVCLSVLYVLLTQKIESVERPKVARTFPRAGVSAAVCHFSV